MNLRRTRSGRVLVFGRLRGVRSLGVFGSLLRLGNLRGFGGLHFGRLVVVIRVVGVMIRRSLTGPGGRRESN